MRSRPCVTAQEGLEARPSSPCCLGRYQRPPPLALACLKRALHRLLGSKEQPRGKASFKVKAGRLEPHPPRPGIPHGGQLHSAKNICPSVTSSSWSSSAPGKGSRRQKLGKDTIHHPFSGTESSQQEAALGSLLHCQLGNKWWHRKVMTSHKRYG